MLRSLIVARKRSAAMTSLSDRLQYKPDQGLPVKGVPVLLVGTLGAALAVAWVLKCLFFQGWYLLFVVPLFAGLLLGAVLYGLVGWTHCRNSWVAGGLGLLGGLVAYVGYYHLCMVDILPPGNEARFDALPHYVVFRMQTDVAEDVARPDDARAKKAVPWLNWMGFLFELAVVAGAPAAIAAKRARNAYCLDLRQWMHRETAVLPPFCSEPLLHALRSGQLEEFVARQRPGGDAQAACRFILEYAVPTDDTPLAYPIYASIKDLSNEKSMFRPRRVPRTYLRQVALTTPEVLTLRPLFPRLARFLEIQHAELRDAPADVLPAVTEPAVATDTAVITAVPEPFRQRVRTSGYALKVNLIGLAPLLFILAGAGLLYLGWHFFSKDEIALSIGPFIVGALSVAWGIYVALYCMSVYENRWIERRLRAEIGQRPDPLVDPASAEASYVSLIPRDSFTQVKLTMSSDLLLMRIDGQRREALLEGDCDRYRIPAGAIETCEPQCFFHPMDAQHHNELWMVRLMVRVKQGMRELLLSVNQTGWRPRTNTTRQEGAQETCRKINALRPTLKV
jgi:hypothetical protein